MSKVRWTRNHDTIHTTPDCSALRHAKKPLPWLYARGKTVEQIAMTIAGTAPWLRRCKRCWPVVGGNDE